jgi:phage-related protein
MAAELIGTAYVRIKAITSGLASDISDGLDRGVRDAQADTDRAGQRLGRDLGDGTSEGFGDTFGDGIADEVTDALDAPEIHRGAERAGGSYSRDVGKGFGRENRRRNPFASLLDSLERIGDAIPTGGAKLWGTLFSPQIVQSLAPALSSTITGLTAGLGFLTEAAAGAGVAMIGGLTVAIPGFGVLLAALKADTEELENFKKAASDLVAPWKQVAAATQRTLLPGLEGALDALQQLVPLFTEFGTQIGQIGGDVAFFGAHILTSERNLGALADILGSSEGAWREMGDAALAVIDGILPFLAAAAPLGEQMAGSFRRMAERFRDVSVAGRESGTLAVTFQTWYDRLRQVVDIVGNLAGALWDVLTIGADNAQNIFDRIQEVTQGWLDFTNSVEGQNAIQGWYDRSKPLLSEIWGLLGDISEVFIKPLVFSDDESVSSMTTFIRTLREDWLPVLGELSRSLSGNGLGEALGRLADSFIGLLDALAGSGTLSSTVETLAGAMDLMASALANPIFQTITPYLFTLLGVLKGLSILAGPLRLLVPVISGLGSALAFLAGGSAIAVLATVLGALALSVGAVYLAFQNWDTIVGWLEEGYEWFSKLSGPVKILAGAFGGLVILTNPIGLFATAVLGITAALKNLSEIGTFFSGVGANIAEFFTGLKDAVLGLPETLGGVVDSIGSFFSGLPERLSELASSIPETLSDVLVDGMKALPGAILDGLGGLGEIGSNILGLIADGLQAGLPRLAEFFTSLPGRILRFIGNVAGTIVPIGVEIIGNLVQGLVQALPRVAAFFISLPFRILTILRRGIQEMIELGVEMMVGLIVGLARALPRIITWFQELPGRIIGFISDASLWLQDTGRLILQGLLSGLASSLTTIGSWFANLPGYLMTMMSGAATWLVETGGMLIDGLLAGIQMVWTEVNTFFAGAPAAVLAALGDFFGAIWAGLSAGAGAFLSNVDNWVGEVVIFFAGLPGRAISAVGDLGGAIWGAVSGGFATALSNIGTWVSDAWGKLSDFASQAPGKVASFATGLAAKIGEGTSAAFSKINEWVSDAWGRLTAWASEAPNKVASFATSLPARIAEGTVAALRTITTWVTDALGKIASFASQVPGKLAGIAGDLAGAMYNALKNAWNSAARRLSVTVDLPGPFGSLTLGVPTFAQGGIIGGTQWGTMLIAGEGGRSEAIVPMERPSRALAVLQEAGLDRLVLEAYLGGIVRQGGAATAGDVTMLRIDNAVIAQPVDADMLAQKTASAYRRLAG